MARLRRGNPHTQPIRRVERAQRPLQDAPSARVSTGTRRGTGHVVDKVTFVAEQCERLGVGLDQVVAIGDGRSDLPLFHSVGFSVAVNASSEARAAASATVDSQSFLDALTAVPGLLDQATR
jgi:phosphoserine phosphatase